MFFLLRQKADVYGASASRSDKAAADKLDTWGDA
jgi:hypothetical protein